MEAARPHGWPAGTREMGTCQTARFTDGNQMRLSLSHTVAEGVEVQYRPNRQVITIIGRNTSRGKPFNLTSAELVDLVQDPRLQLPKF